MPDSFNEFLPLIIFGLFFLVNYFFIAPWIASRISYERSRWLFEKAGWVVNSSCMGIICLIGLVGIAYFARVTVDDPVFSAFVTFGVVALSTVLVAVSLMFIREPDAKHERTIFRLLLAAFVTLGVSAISDYLGLSGIADILQVVSAITATLAIIFPWIWRTE